MLLFLSLLILCAPLGGEASPISCYNDQGEAVDWFYIYKLPKEHGRKSPIEGERYLLLEKGSAGWTDGKGSVNETTGALGRTVGQLYSQGKVCYLFLSAAKVELNFWFMFLEATPVKVSIPPGFSSFRFLVVHVFNTFILKCLTEFWCGEQLQINQPYVYDCDVPESLASVVPALAAVCKKKHLSGQMFPHVKPVSNRSVTLTSKDGTDFISFAKGASFDNDLYHSWVAPTLQSDLLVQFWIRSTGILPSDCSLGWKVLDITLIHPGQTFSFKASQDHSKWAVSPKAAGQGAGGGWVCVGDINRNEAEEKRGGGTVCLRDPVVWKAYRTAALECEACGGGTIHQRF
uniref:Deoxyribonuclease-2-alpha n=1 Tax=Stegastes partitus TaxID=144197 RepID=A0A3B5ANA8_9TELE